MRLVEGGRAGRGVQVEALRAQRLRTREELDLGVERTRRDQNVARAIREAEARGEERLQEGLVLVATEASNLHDTWTHNLSDKTFPRYDIKSSQEIFGLRGRP